MSELARALAELAQEELGLVVAGRWQDLAGVHARRDELLAQLPHQAAPGDRPILERALQMQREVERLIERARSETSAQLMRLDRGRTAARGYALATGAPLSLKRG